MTAPTPPIRPQRLNHVIGVGLMIVTLLSTIWFRRTSTGLATESGPSATASLQAQAGVQRTQAALHGWVSVGDERFRAERRAAWREAIDPAMASLHTLSSGWSAAERKRFEAVAKHLRELAEAQKLVEDVAHTPRNDPARALHDEKLAPAADAAVASTHALLEAQRRAPTPDATTVTSLATLHGVLLEASLRCSRAHQGERRSPAKLMATARAEIARLEGDGGARSGDEAAKFKALASQVRSFDALVKKHGALVMSQGDTVARGVLRTRVTPAAQQVATELGALSAAHARRMADDAGRVVKLSRVVLWIAALLVVLMLVVAVFTGLPGRAAPATEPIEGDPRGLAGLDARYPGALRVGALWVIIPAWLVGIMAVLQPPDARQALVAAVLSFVVGSLLNTLNWSVPSARRADRVVWVLRFFGNYLVPFTVSVSSSLVAALG